jgi:hypothetical protein
MTAPGPATARRLRRVAADPHSHTDDVRRACHGARVEDSRSSWSDQNFFLETVEIPASRGASRLT